MNFKSIESIIYQKWTDVTRCALQVNKEHMHTLQTWCLMFVFDLHSLFEPKKMQHVIEKCHFVSATKGPLCWRSWADTVGKNLLCFHCVKETKETLLIHYCWVWYYFKNTLWPDWTDVWSFLLACFQIPGSGQCPGMWSRLGVYTRNASWRWLGGQHVSETLWGKHTHHCAVRLVSEITNNYLSVLCTVLHLLLARVRSNDKRLCGAMDSASDF